MLTVSIVITFLFTVRKNFHFQLPALFVVLLNELGKSFEWQVAEGPFAVDFVLGPVTSATGTPSVSPAPGSKEAAKVPAGTVVPAPSTVEPDPTSVKVPIATIPIPVQPAPDVTDDPVPNANPFTDTGSGTGTLNGDNE